MDAIQEIENPLIRIIQLWKRIEQIPYNMLFDDSEREEQNVRDVKELSTLTKQLLSIENAGFERIRVCINELAHDYAPDGAMKRGYLYQRIKRVICNRICQIVDSLGDWLDQKNQSNFPELAAFYDENNVRGTAYSLKETLTNLNNEIELQIRQGLPYAKNPDALYLNQPAPTPDEQETPNGFESYLKPEYQYLIPFLKKYFTNRKPEVYGYLIFALKEEEVTIESFNRNKSNLHRALSKTFGLVGTYENLRKQIQQLESEQERNADSNNQINDIRLKVREVKSQDINQVAKKL